MKRIPNKYKFWNPESGVVGGLICGAICGASLVAVYALIVSFIRMMK